MICIDSSISTTQSNTPRTRLIQLPRLHLALFLILNSIAGLALAQDDSRPNILLITADDMGYTDIASFGGEIRTPNLDTLALTGVRLTNFHVGPACSQTRTMLMSGTYTEVGGITGSAAATPLQDNVVALPQFMKDAGYHTYMSGKWHLGGAENQHPAAEGFESSFALNGGAAEHFYFGGNISNGQRYIENGVPVGFPDGAYSTELYTDKMLSYLQSNEGDGQPFFAWYTPTAPHWPLQVPEDYLNLYDGAYDTGYEDLLRKRIQRAEQMGVLPGGFTLEDYPRTGASWDSLSENEQKIEARKMELYAAMMENFDFHIGRIIDYLKASGQYENTLIVFSSDNGADTSVREFGPGPQGASEGIDNSYDNLGRASSYISVGAWGDVHSAPFKYQKGTQGEGGIRAPAFIHYGSVDNKGGVDNRFLTIMDMMPTFIELAGSERSNQYQGREILPSAGVSFADLVLGAEATIEHSSGTAAVWYSEALYKDEWKLALQPRGNGDWLLYNLREDPSETTNLAGRNPELLTELVAEWTSIGEEAGYNPEPPAPAGSARGGARAGARGAAQ